MITQARHNGGATYVTFGASHQLKARTGRVVIASATAGNLSLRLPDASRRNAGGIHFYVANVGANSFDLTTYGSSARYAASVPIVLGLGSTYGTQAITPTGTENGSTWAGSVAMPSALGTLSVNLHVSGSKPSFVLSVTTPTGTANFSLTWDGYSTIASVSQTSHTGDGAAYTITSLGNGAVIVTSIPAAKTAVVALTSSQNNKANPCGGVQGWATYLRDNNGTRATGAEPGAADPCVPDATSPPPPPPPPGPCNNCWQCRDCDTNELVNHYVDQRFFEPGDIAMIGPPEGQVCYIVGDVAVSHEPEAAQKGESCESCIVIECCKDCLVCDNAFYFNDTPGGSQLTIDWSLSGQDTGDSAFDSCVNLLGVGPKILDYFSGHTDSWSWFFTETDGETYQRDFTAEFDCVARTWTLTAHVLDAANNDHYWIWQKVGSGAGVSGMPLTGGNCLSSLGGTGSANISVTRNVSKLDPTILNCSVKQCANAIKRQSEDTADTYLVTGIFHPCGAGLETGIPFSVALARTNPDPSGVWSASGSDLNELEGYIESITITGGIFEADVCRWDLGFYSSALCLGRTFNKFVGFTPAGTTDEWEITQYAGAPNPCPNPNPNVCGAVQDGCWENIVVS